MCEFCIMFDFSTASAKVEQGIAKIMKAPEGIPFLPKQQFNFCPICGSPREPQRLSGNRFGQNMRRIRRMRGMTQEALGRELGIQRSAVCKYEKGRVKPDITQLLKICQTLDVAPSELL